MFGDDMLVAPITAPLASNNDLAAKSIWLPPGTWIEWFTGAVLKGPAKVERSFGLDEIPVYVKAGAIIPMQPKMLHTGDEAGGSADPHGFPRRRRFHASLCRRRQHAWIQEQRIRLDRGAPVATGEHS